MGATSSVRRSEQRQRDRERELQQEREREARQRQLEQEQELEAERRVMRRLIISAFQPATSRSFVEPNQGREILGSGASNASNVLAGHDATARMEPLPTSFMIGQSSGSVVAAAAAAMGFPFPSALAAIADAANAQGNATSEITVSSPAPASSYAVGGVGMQPLDGRQNFYFATPTRVGFEFKQDGIWSNLPLNLVIFIPSSPTFEVRAVSERLLQHLEAQHTRIYTEGDCERLDPTDGECVICHEAFAVGHQVCHLPSCAHHFHMVCIRPWLQRSNTCPLCRCVAIRSTSLSPSPSPSPLP